MKASGAETLLFCRVANQLKTQAMNYIYLLPVAFVALSLCLLAYSFYKVFKPSKN